MNVSPVHLAGVGISEHTDSSFDKAAVSAGTKALLDAGITYSDVGQSVACFLDEDLRVPRSCFDTFGMEGAPTCEVDNDAGLFTAVQCIRSGQSECALLIGIDKAASSGKGKTQVVAVAMVLVSKLFLTSHAYLKDSATCIRACSLANRVHSRSSGGTNNSRTINTAVQAALRQAQLEALDVQIVEARHSSKEDVRQTLSGFRFTQSRQPPKSFEAFTGTTGLAGLCEIVWQLRGWAANPPVSKAENCLHYTSRQDGAVDVVILSRSDGKATPSWKDIENVRDGRERLGYNPAVEVRKISHEDLNAVRARKEFTSDEAVKQLQLPVKGGDRAALARL